MKQARKNLSSIKTILSSAGLLVITLTIGVFVSQSSTSATDTPSASDSADASVTVGEACSMTGSGMSSHSAEIPNGTYQDEIGTTTIKITCNDSAGFSVYAVGYTGDTIGETNSTKLVGRNTNSLISTSTATSGDNSAWAMKLGTNGSATYAVSLQNGFGSYSAVPASYTKVATRTAGTDVGTGATGSTITTTYASFISRTQPADTYDGKVKYTLVHPNNEAPAQPQQATAGCINYFANASSAVGTMGCQSATDGNTITLLASNFSRTGYGFAGWSDKYDYATNSSAKFYGPQEDITVPTGTTTNGLSLYAVWIKSEGSIQDANKVTALCGTNGTGGTLTTAPTDGTANLSSVSALTDQRDNQTYAIARLADNKCWMIENLRLEAESTRTTEKQALAQGYGSSSTYGNFGGLADAESSNFSSSTTANSLYYSGTQSGTASIDIGTTNSPGYRMPRHNNLNTSTRATNPTSNTFPNNNTTGGMYSYGNYYTWHAAIADLTYNGEINQSTTGTSLCPAGWHLPKGGSSANASNSEFWQYGLAIMGNAPSNSGAYQSSETNANGDTATKALRKYPNNFLYSGYFTTSSAIGRGSYGYYWSSTASNSNYSYLLLLYSSNVNPGTNNYSKSLGQSIRCTVGS